MTADLVHVSNALTARWAWEACDGTTTAFSGAGAWPLLAFLAAAAREPGRGELQRAIGIDATDAERRGRELLGIFSAATAAKAALGVWTRHGLPVEQWWHDAVPDAARGELTGDPAADRSRLDEWVRRNTADRLTSMPVQLREDTALVLATALSIDTRWRDPFEDFPFTPQSGPWARKGGRPLAGLSLRTPDIDRLAIAETPTGRIILLTVHGVDDVDVMLCLGPPRSPAGEVLAHAMAAADGQHRLHRGAEVLKGSLARKTPGLNVTAVSSFDERTMLDVATVRFDITAEHDLLARPEVFGLETVSTYDPRGHLPGISSAPLGVGQAVQDVTATFTAEGFRAAAVTAMAMDLMGVPMGEARVLNVRFDRPFGFFARHRPSGLALLAGWIAEPQDWPDDRSTIPMPF